MKNKKSPKNLITIFLIVTILLLIFLITLQTHQLHNKNSEEGNKIIPESSSNSAHVSEEKHLQYEKPIPQLESQNNEIQSNKIFTDNKNEIITPQKPVKKYPINLISNKRLEENAEAERKNYKYYYVPFLEKLGISPDTIHELTELHSNRRIEKEKIYEKYYEEYGEELNRSIYLELNDDLESFNENYDDKIQDLLEAENLESYDLFDKSIVNREMVLTFNKQLNPDEKLNEEKTEEFILSLYDIDTDFYPENSRFNPAITGKPYPYLEVSKLKNKEYLIEAKRILSGLQYRLFVEYKIERDEVIDSFVASGNY